MDYESGTMFKYPYFTIREIHDLILLLSLYPSNSKMLLSLNTNTLLKSKDEYVNKLLQLRTSIYKKIITRQSVKIEIKQ